MREGLAAIRATGAEMGLPYFLALLGEMLGKAGQPDLGLIEIEHALAGAQQRGQYFQHSEVLRLKGELLLMLSKSRRREAEASFRDAIKVAHRQRARLPHLKAAMSMARLLIAKGDSEQALMLLEPACGGISANRGLADVQSAQALLAQLRAQMSRSLVE